jgi:hypothetical protein
MKNNTLKKIGLMIVAAGLLFGLIPKLSFAGNAAPTNFSATVDYNCDQSGKAWIDFSWQDNATNEVVIKLWINNDAANPGFGMPRTCVLLGPNNTSYRDSFALGQKYYAVLQSCAGTADAYYEFSDTINSSDRKSVV